MQSLKPLKLNLHVNDILFAVPQCCESCNIIYSKFAQRNWISNKPIHKRTMKTEQNRSHHPISMVSCLITSND